MTHAPNRLLEQLIQTFELKEVPFGSTESFELTRSAIRQCRNLDELKSTWQNNIKYISKLSGAQQRELITIKDRLKFQLL